MIFCKIGTRGQTMLLGVPTFEVENNSVVWLSCAQAFDRPKSHIRTENCPGSPISKIFPVFRSRCETFLECMNAIADATYDDNTSKRRGLLEMCVVRLPRPGRFHPHACRCRKHEKSQAWGHTQPHSRRGLFKTNLLQNPRTFDCFERLLMAVR